MEPDTRESEVSRVIRVLAEVEKIWITYDLDGNDSLEMDEITHYMEGIQGNNNQLSKLQIEQIFKEIDTNHDGNISKEEMFKFVTYVDNAN